MIWLETRSRQQLLEELLSSIKLLKLNWQKRFKSVKIGDDKEFTEFGLKYWRQHVERFAKENQEFLTNRAKSKGEANFCQELIADFICLVELYEQSIMNDLTCKDYQSAKLTILIAITDIRKYRCKLFAFNE